MKPCVEGTTDSGSDVAGEMECEMQARDFFLHVGMLIMEGRTPQHSDKGCIEGPHCLSWVSMTPHICDLRTDYRCQKAAERRQKMTVLWQNSSPMVITVLTQTIEDKKMILLERWTVNAINGTDNEQGCSGSVLIQAIRSHIHFSQLSAWLSRSKGFIPSQIIYRISYDGGEDNLLDERFLKEPDFHTFPLANLYSNRVLQVSVQSLPRYNVFNLTDEILALKLDQLSGNSTCDCKENEDLLDESIRSPLKKKSCISQHDADNDSQTRNGHNCWKNHENILECLKPSTSTCRTCSMAAEIQQVASRNCENQNVLNSARSSQNSLRGRVLKSDSLGEGIRGNSFYGTINEHLSKKDLSVHNSETKEPVSEGRKFDVRDSKSSSKIFIPCGVFQAEFHSRCVASGTLPIFNSRTGLPISSSPAALRRSATDWDINNDTSSTNRDAERSSTKDLTAILSKSAPASTTQSLLGNFEESVLNGRMEPLGTVEGFMAELGASGSFCPAHVTLPVKAYFFSLSDDNAPSPYLGYIDLNDPSISRKGYHVPTKGTVQLTLFNPNKTVVKMFVVLYNFSDMPPKAQTFLRQRTFSVWKRPCHSGEDQNSLHYLIHLRFVSSKSARLYLHTDIRVIFARQPPDLPNGVSYCTVTDGPTEPKYTL